MPIRASERARYPKDWKAISARIRERDGNRCKQCDVPNGAIIVRGKSDPAKWMEFREYDSILPPEIKQRDWRPRTIRVVLTTAHLDHQPESVADDNLAALCQRCHLRYDSEHHQRNARATRRSRKAVGDLFESGGNK